MESVSIEGLELLQQRNSPFRENATSLQGISLLLLGQPSLYLHTSGGFGGAPHDATAKLCAVPHPFQSLYSCTSSLSSKGSQISHVCVSASGISHVDFICSTLLTSCIWFYIWSNGERTSLIWCELSLRLINMSIWLFVLRFIVQTWMKMWPWLNLARLLL